tara:strand:+ start:492 stop:1991 length:1500 start_codon:yes stop_codon:yes gene_type:complete
MLVINSYTKKNNDNIKVFLIFEENSLISIFKKHKIKAPNSVLDDFNGKKKEIIQFYNGNEIIVLLGLGRKNKLDIDNLGHIINHLDFFLKTIKKENIIYYLGDGDIERLKDQITLLSNIHYNQKNFMNLFFMFKEKFSKKKTVKSSKNTKNVNNTNNNKKNINNVIIKSFKNVYFVTDRYVKKLNEYLKLITSVNLVKDIGNAPANVLTPPTFIRIIKTYAKKSNFNVHIMGDKTLSKLGMNTLLSVSQGSKYSGYLVRISLKTANIKEKPTVLVGKGITFDSGGTSLKRPVNMINMKTDMLGAATIFGYMNHLATIKSEKNVIGLLAIAENMPGKDASRPGDVVKAFNGKTVEIVDTDAEGRLVMADALSYAHKFKPKLIMNIAGLTGQQASISGGLFATVMGNNKKKLKEFMEVGEKVNERLVDFPLYDEYKEQTKSEIADYKNYNYNFKHGTIYAGAFLCNFIEEGQDWIHMDIAGPESNKKGVTGFGVRLLNNFI